MLKVKTLRIHGLNDALDFPIIYTNDNSIPSNSSYPEHIFSWNTNTILSTWYHISLTSSVKIAKFIFLKLKPLFS